MIRGDIMSEKKLKFEIIGYGTAGSMYGQWSKGSGSRDKICL